MTPRSFVAVAVLLASSASASLVPVGPVPYSGTGIGAVNTVLTVGFKPTESGCVKWNGVTDVLGPTACTAGFPGGNEKTGASQTQTRTISQLGLTTAQDLRIVLNMNESVGNAATLTNLSLTIYDPAGAVLFTTGVFIAPTFPLIHSPGTTVGYVFELDDVQAAQAQLVFAPTNRIGLMTNLSNTTAGDETFYVADVTAIGVPLFGADLAIVKTATPAAIAGTNVAYTWNAVNNGPDPATNVVIADPLPAPLVSFAPPAGWSCTTPAVGTIGSITCMKAAMAVLETVSFSAVVRICPETACGAIVPNTATITSTTIDPVTANGVSTAATTVQAQSDLAITKTASAASVNAGGSLIYTLSITNAGPSNSVGTTVIDTLPAGFTAVLISSSTGTCSGTGTSTVNCSLGTIGAAGQCATAFPATATITITAQVDPTAAAGIYTNTASVATANCLADPNLANNVATLPVTIPALPVGADVAIAKIAPSTVIAGTTMSYTLDVTNAGPDAATSPVVTDALPAGTRFVSLSAPAGWSCAAPAIGAIGTVTCTKASIAVAETALFAIVVRICPETACGTIIANTATASSATADTVPGNNSSTANTTVQAQSDLAVTKTAQPASLLPGDPLTYTLTVSNGGPSNSVGTTVVDTLPAGFTASSAGTTLGTCSIVGSTITCTLGQLGAANQCATAFPTSATITITAQAGATIASGTYTNTATVSTGNCLADANLANNTATAQTIVGIASLPVPTLSEIGLIIFGVLLLLVGTLYVRS